MLERTMSEFIAETEKLTIGAITNDEFVIIRSSAGNAVLISEAEWDILRGSLKMILNAV